MSIIFGDSNEFALTAARGGKGVMAYDLFQHAYELSSTYTVRDILESWKK